MCLWQKNFSNVAFLIFLNIDTRWPQFHISNLSESQFLHLYNVASHISNVDYCQNVKCRTLYYILLDHLESAHLWWTVPQTLSESPRKHLRVELKMPLCFIVLGIPLKLREAAPPHVGTIQKCRGVNAPGMTLK